MLGFFFDQHLDEGFKIFLEIADNCGLIGGSEGTKFYKD